MRRIAAALSLVESWVPCKRWTWPLKALTHQPYLEGVKVPLNQAIGIYLECVRCYHHVDKKNAKLSSHLPA
jgi:hypothetical protein